MSWMEWLAPAAAVAVAVGMRRRRARVLAGAASAALILAGSSGVGALAASRVTGHMIQHLVIILVAAPAMGIALATGNHRLSRVFRPVLSGGVWNAKAPLTAGAAHSAAVVVWHLPVAYDAALGSAMLHSLEHASLFGTGVWWWASLAHHARRHSIGPVIVTIFGASAVGTVVGAFLMFSSRAMYAHGDVLDQQLAGALMAGVMGAGLALAAAGMVTAHLGRVGPDLARARASRHIGAVLVLAAAVLTMMLAAPPAIASQHEEPAPDLEHGASLYRRDCASCHGPAGEGSRRGPSLAGTGEAANFYYLHTGRMPIPSPDSPVERSRPAYDSRQLSDLVAFAATLGEGPGMPAVGDRGADVSAGGVHYRLHCSSCHGAGGAGGALAVDEYAPSLMTATTEDVVAAVISGPGTMPSFEGVVDEEAMVDVAAHVAHLQDPPTMGLPLPGGRVGEGLAAAVAMAVLLGAARLIGESS